MRLSARAGKASSGSRLCRVSAGYHRHSWRPNAVISTRSLELARAREKTAGGLASSQSPWEPPGATVEACPEGPDADDSRAACWEPWGRTSAWLAKHVQRRAQRAEEHHCPRELVRLPDSCSLPPVWPRRGRARLAGRRARGAGALPHDSMLARFVGCLCRGRRQRYACLRSASEVLSYNVGMISTCETGLQWQRALSLLSQIWEAKVVPNGISRSAGILACDRNGQGQRAIWLHKETYD
ncbi:unnamed protein product [Prorocentrum cordatum]|uniref:Uncharacterized protein n=1 Tax=Prorocentrum cordatum TaxID=2364126 RepID=A0ABN9VD87_9DINO|nr:unnamed protein product [Polarella glacialis]